jgi:hypothetical protein
MEVACLKWFPLMPEAICKCLKALVYVGRWDSNVKYYEDIMDSGVSEA